jgi:Uma2 family endonuclease
MTTATTQIPTTQAPASYEVPGPSTVVPSLAELERLAELPERRVVFRDVDWSFYDAVVNRIPEGRNLHADFDGRDLELMGNGPYHEDLKHRLGLIIHEITVELGIPCKGLAETTWKRPELKRGIEADQSYIFKPAKLALIAGVRDWNQVEDFPNPDLAIEIDISRPQIDREGIYAALGVEELWRVAYDAVVIERLSSDGGAYAPVETSGFLPVRAADLTRWLIENDSRDESAWTRRLRAEIRGGQP